MVMNKQLIEFAYQSGLFDGTGQVPMKDVEKFAESIIQDCIAQCQGVGNVIESMYDGEEARSFKAVADNCERMIKQRFGIE